MDMKKEPVLVVTWKEWVDYMDGRCGKLSGWNLLRAKMLPGVLACEGKLIYRGKSARDLEGLVQLYDNNATNPVGKAYWQEPLLTFIAEVGDHAII